MAIGRLRIQKNFDENTARRIAHKPVWENIINYLLYFVRVFVILFIVYLIIKDNAFQTINVSGNSMEPNISNGDVVYVNKTTPQFFIWDVGGIKRGDVVIVNLENSECAGIENEDDCFYIKRVVGLPGEEVEVRDGYVYINGVVTNEVEFELKESYLGDNEGKTYPQIKQNKYPTGAILKDKEYYVMGDNRQLSKDSRSIGPVTSDMITGKVFYSKERGWLDLPSYNISN